MDVKKIKDDVQYRVILSQKIEVVPGQVLYPGHDVVLRGNIVKAFAAAIVSAEAVGA